MNILISIDLDEDVKGNVRTIKKGELEKLILFLSRMEKNIVFGETYHIVIKEFRT